MKLASAPLLHLLQLASPSLPIGAYSYSQGLEAALQAGIVSDEAGARAWIAGQLTQVVARFEAPVFCRLLQAFAARDANAVAHWNERFLAARDTAELRAETLQMGQSLAKLLADLGVEVPIEEPALPTAYACAARAWGIGSNEAAVAYLWSWLENQVMAAVKAVPLGQTAGQKILLELGARLDQLAEREPQWSNFAPGLAVLSTRHETQYSRLFRS
jgi:urease accessory protein